MVTVSLYKASKLPNFLLNFCDCGYEPTGTDQCKRQSPKANKSKLKHFHLRFSKAFHRIVREVGFSNFSNIHWLTPSYKSKFKTLQSKALLQGNKILIEKIRKTFSKIFRKNSS